MRNIKKVAIAARVFRERSSQKRPATYVYCTYSEPVLNLMGNERGV